MNTNLPPGFRFFPSDEELVVHFLRRKAGRLPCQPDIIPTIDLCRSDPWQLNGKALQGDDKWYFFTRRAEDRITEEGYWMPVGVDEPVTSNDAIVGTKKTLIYHVGEAQEGTKTNWVMHEFHLLDGVACTSSSGTSGRRSSSSKKRGPPRIEANKWAVCRVYEATCGSPTSFYDEGAELSCLDEVFLSLDDYDEISLPN